MKLKSIISAFIFLTTLTSYSQNSKVFYNLNNNPQIDLRATSLGSYKVINVDVSNFGSESVEIIFPVGGIFINLDSTEQNLVVLFNDKLLIDPGKNKQISIGTACANPKRKVPANKRTTWQFDYNRKVGDLINYYHDNRPIVEMLTGSEYHNTIEKRHNFLQMCVWIYYDANKKHILDFATKYIFEGNKEQAVLYIDVFYPIAVTFINIYKSL
jgi:hypothetical protein